MKILKLLLKVILWTAGIWLVTLTILQFALTPTLLRGLVDKYASEYVDADLSFGDVRLSMFRHFPNIGFTLEDFSITYPADRFDAREQEGIQGWLTRQGCGEKADTLASFERFSISITMPSLIAGHIRIPYASLTKPRIFAHSYRDGSANWDIFSSGVQDAAPADTSMVEIADSSTVAPADSIAASEGGLPKISLGYISMRKHPHIVYTDSKDTVFAMVNMKRMLFKGRITNGKAARNRIGLSIDSMFISGRLPKDTLALGVDMISITEEGRRMDLDINAKTFLATRAGRIHFPINISSQAELLRDEVPAIAISDFHADVAYIPIDADAVLRFGPDSTSVQGKISITECSVNDIIRKLVTGIIPEAGKISTDAIMNMEAECDGHYVHSNGRLPALKMKMTVPDASISHTGLGQNARIGLEADVATDQEGRLNMEIRKMAAGMKGFEFNFKGGMSDILGDDPAFRIDGQLSAQLDTLGSFLPDTAAIELRGGLDASVKGSVKLSELDIYRFSQAELTGLVAGEGLFMESKKDTLSAYIDGMEIRLGPEILRSRRDSSRTYRMIGVSCSIDSTDISYKNALNLNGKGIKASLRNSTQKDGSIDTTKINPLSGRLSAEKLFLKDGGSSRVMMTDSENSFMLLPQKNSAKVPLLTFSSRNRRLFLTYEVNRVMLSDADISASAALNTVERRNRAKAFIDSLARVYPGVPKDSLFIHAMAQRSRMEVPEWLKEEDFRKNDLNLKLDETLAKYFREWDLNGKIGLRAGILMTPYFPIRTTLKGFAGSFTNDGIRIDSMKVSAGGSNLSANGSLSGLKRALLGRGIIDMKLDVRSQMLDANEMISTYTAGMNYTPPVDTEHLEEADDAEFMEMISRQDSSDVAASQLFVIPANLNADITLDARNITYSGLDIDKMTADLLMKERCVQITNTKAISNMGDIHFEGFYSTRSKKDLKAGFSFNFVDITAEKVISLMPAIDTLMPMLKSFRGLLNCEIAATADIDTNMNIVMPSINGIIRIGGKHLTISDNDMFRTLARKLLFKNKKTGFIDNMTVEGVIKDNRLEIFPFVLNMDRYTLAMSGIQGLDMSFRYHVSVLKSPILIKLGVDLSGPDFDNMKFRIGKAKYKDINVPAFSTVIDQTKINLVKSIQGIFEKGVDAAIREHSKQNAIIEHRRKTGYVNAADMEMEELSDKEKQQMEEAEKAEEAGEAEVTGGDEGTIEESSENQENIQE